MGHVPLCVSGWATPPPLGCRVCRPASAWNGVVRELVVCAVWGWGEARAAPRLFGVSRWCCADLLVPGLSVRVCTLVYMSVRWDLRVPEGLAEAVDALAESRGQTRTRVVVTALAAALDGLDADLSRRPPGPVLEPYDSGLPSEPIVDVVPLPPKVQKGLAVPRRAPFNVGPRPFAKPIPKGK
jgi:hypothetical protein